MTDNKGGGSAGAASATTDKVFLLSSTEIWGNLDGDGTQYEYYKSKGVSTSKYSGASLGFYRWTRSVYPNGTAFYRCASSDGDYRSYNTTETYYVSPVWCF